MEESVREVGESWNDLRSQLDKAVVPILDRSLDRICESIDTVDRELKSHIRTIVQNNREAGPRVIGEALRSGLGEKFDTLGDSLARAIAKTSATVTITSSQREVWTQLGIRYKWLSQRDGKARESHEEPNVKGPDRHGWFKVGADLMQYPGGDSLAEENVNCRCILRPIVNTGGAD
jgi:hypothetical protein